jgi:hypothetical protein
MEQDQETTLSRREASWRKRYFELHTPRQRGFCFRGRGKAL